MTREEFENRATRFINDSDYMIVEYVYTWHPSIDANKGKDQIAQLYSTFGMRIINDMVPTAQRAEELDSKIRAARNELERLKAEYEELKR